MTETAHVTPAEVVAPPPEAPAAPAAPPSAPQQAGASAEDGLLALFMELPRERDRLGALEDPSTRKLAREIADTVLPLLQDFIGEALTERGNAHHFRDWVLQQGFPARDAHIAELNERLLELEQQDPETPWDEETALPRWTLAVLRKRAPWLPGKENVIPSQLCTACRWDHHGLCWQPMAGRRWVLKNDDPKFHECYLPTNFRCTCTDPAHDGDAE